MTWKLNLYVKYEKGVEATAWRKESVTTAPHLAGR
jgi:hypothetical protein